MRIAVKDASILIDLAEAELLGLWFQLGIETHATDFVLNEVSQEEQWKAVAPFVDAKLIRKHATAPAEMAETALFATENGISVPDASGVLLAKRLGAMLLTGDRRMRRTATARSIEVHGVLWIMDQLVDARILPKPEALVRLRKVLQAGSHLPHAECDARIKAWGARV
jgi:predicted nucleic acid-binding protein